VPRYLPKTQKGLENYLRKNMAYYNPDPWNHWTANATTSAITTNIWGNWTAGTAASSTNIVWNHWAGQQYPPTGSSITTEAWTYWQASQHNLQPQYAPPPQLTAEEQERRQRVQAEARAKSVERFERIAEAKARAKALLLDHLSPVQKRDYEEKGSFRVEVGHRTFQINPGCHGNVKEVHLQNGQWVIVRSFCIPSGRHDLPEPDVHLSQKLMLEGGEDSVLDFHRIANITEYRPDLVPRLDRELAAA
jgi:hypothetical protein